MLHGFGDLGTDLRSVGCAGTQHQLQIGVHVVGCGDQVANTLLPGDATDEHRDGACRIDADVGQDRCRVGGVHRMPRVGVDAIADHMHLVRVEARIRIAHVDPHAGTDRDHGICVFDGVLLHPARHAVPTAELLGFPGSAGFE